ncbi:MAG TPA: 3-hydroxybutyrate dehydrogenase, partial [Kiloniellales bacterium]|nr:3-hydroxybutyrate dehydrogenase [Kiloniellales bacterium]
YHGADMARPSEIEEMMMVAATEHGRVDILVNNAGIQHVADIADFPPERWDAIIAINLSSAFHTTRLALPAMREAGWGRIINVASVHGLVASKHKAAYVAAKHGIIGLTKATALDAAGSRVTCNAICPGWVLTNLVQQQVDALAQREGLEQDAAKARLVGEKMPTAEFVTPEQIAALTAFLCGPHANQISGASFPVDGAWTAQ